LSTLSRIHYLFSYFSLAKFRVANEMMSISTSDINGIEDIANRLTAIITNQIDSLNISVKKAQLNEISSLVHSKQCNMCSETKGDQETNVLRINILVSDENIWSLWSLWSLNENEL
jgi:hypothetical protein